MHGMLIGSHNRSVVNTEHLQEILIAQEGKRACIYFFLAPNQDATWYFDTASERDAAFAQLKKTIGVQEM